MTNNKTILLVDDNPDILDLVNRWLAEADYQIQRASSGEEALALLAGTVFSALLLDIVMPDISGIEVLELIQNRYPNMVRIMITGVDDPIIAKRSRQLGADGYLIKPFAKNELLICIEQALYSKELEGFNRECQDTLEGLVQQRTAELQEAMARLKENQEQLIQQEKLATIGHLAAGVAHEIKNPIGYIASNLSTLHRHHGKLTEFIGHLSSCAANLPAGQSADLPQTRQGLQIDFILNDIPEIISECVEGVDRIKTIIEGLKTFSRKEQESPRPADINDCLESAITVAWNELKYKVTIDKKFAELPLVDCYPNQLSQVFMNLLVNAAQAITGKGQITITTAPAEHDYVRITIADTGCGISESSQGKIFEPFYTTKEAGVGTGLGLSIVREIIARHNGSIKVASEPEKGSVFTILLPVHA